MNRVFLLTFCLVCGFAQSQTQYQAGIGAGLNFLQSVKMSSGTVGLKFKSDRYLLADYNRTINKNHRLSVGAQFRLSLASYWYELDKAIPYYSEKPHIPIYQFESAELGFYLKKLFKVSVAENSSVHLFINLGPSFNFNEGNSGLNRHSLMDDNGQTFQISRIEYKAQKVYVPYFRITGGLEVLKRVKQKYYVGLSPFISWVGLQSENNDLTVLKDDPAYISKGEFKRTRNGYGLRLLFQNR